MKQANNNLWLWALVRSHIFQIMSSKNKRKFNVLSPAGELTSPQSVDDPSLILSHKQSHSLPHSVYLSAVVEALLIIVSNTHAMFPTACTIHAMNGTPSSISMYKCFPVSRTLRKHFACYARGQWMLPYDVTWVVWLVFGALAPHELVISHKRHSCRCRWCMSFCPRSFISSFFIFNIHFSTF